MSPKSFTGNIILLAAVVACVTIKTRRHRKIAESKRKVAPVLDSAPYVCDLGPQRPSNEQPLINLASQVGGHRPNEGSSTKGFLCSNGVVLKPVELIRGHGKRELSFYESVFTSSSVIDVELRSRFLPRFFGSRLISDNDQNQLYLILEDITHPFSRPSLIDIKMGTKTYEPDASPKKIAYERSKFSGQEELGFRFVGMKVYLPSSCDYVEYGKSFGKSLSAANAADGFLHFLTNSPLRAITNEVSLTSHLRMDIVHSLISKVQNLLDWFEHYNDQYHFIASSLLIVYEGDTAADLDSVKRSRVDLRVIDFAHVRRLEWEGSEARSDDAKTPMLRDDGFIKGLRSIISMLAALTL